MNPTHKKILFVSILLLFVIIIGSIGLYLFGNSNDDSKDNEIQDEQITHSIHRKQQERKREEQQKGKYLKKKRIQSRLDYSDDSDESMMNLKNVNQNMKKVYNNVRCLNEISNLIKNTVGECVNDLQDLPPLNKKYGMNENLKDVYELIRYVTGTLKALKDILPKSLMDKIIEEVMKPSDDQGKVPNAFEKFFKGIATS